MDDAAPVPPAPAPAAHGGATSTAPVQTTAPFAPVPPAPPATALAPAPGAWSTARGATDPYAVQPGAPAGTPYWAPPVAPRQNVLAWVSFGLGLGGLFFGLFTSIAAIVCGHIARRQIRQRGEQGDGAALTGLISGYVLTVLWVLGIAAYIAFIVFLIGASAVSSGVSSSI